MNARTALTGITTSDAIRLFSRVTEGEGGCWLWGGALTYGYGVIGIGSRRTVQAHRMAFASAYGEAPAGMTIDHLCRVRNCVNPDHLEAVSDWENNRRALTTAHANRIKTHCRRGHEFTEDNVYSRRPGVRDCRACRAATMKEWNRKLRKARELGATASRSA